MMNYIWGAMILFAFIAAVFQGNVNELSDSIIKESANAVELCLKLGGSICFWSGLMRIAQRSGLTTAISKMLRPLLKIAFPKMRYDSAEAKAISMNVTANLLGLGNAATPFGLEAMKQLQAKNTNPSVASHEMITFVVLNSAALHLLPTTVAFIRQEFGALNPMDIMPAAWLSSIAALSVAITLTKLCKRRGKNKND